MLTPDAAISSTSCPGDDCEEFRTQIPNWNVAWWI